MPRFSVWAGTHVGGRWERRHPSPVHSVVPPCRDSPVHSVVPPCRDSSVHSGGFPGPRGRPHSSRLVTGARHLGCGEGKVRHEELVIPVGGWDGGGSEPTLPPEPGPTGSDHTGPHSPSIYPGRVRSPRRTPSVPGHATRTTFVDGDDKDPRAVPVVSRGLPVFPDPGSVLPKHSMPTPSDVPVVKLSGQVSS